MITSTITSMMDQISTFKYFPTQKYSPKPPDHSTVLQDNRRCPPLEGGQSTKIGGVWTLKHYIISQKLYEILIDTEQNGDTAMDLKNFYNHIKICINAVNRIREDLLPAHQSIKRHSEFESYFITYCNHPSYY